MNKQTTNKTPKQNHKTPRVAVEQKPLIPELLDEAKARRILGDSVWQLRKIAGLEADLRDADRRREMELARARYIIMTALDALKVDADKAKVALKAAADRWSASRRIVR